MASKQNIKKITRSKGDQSNTNSLERSVGALDAGAVSSASGASNVSGMGAGTGYDVSGELGIQDSTQGIQPGGSHETSGVAGNTGRGSGSGAAGSMSSGTGGGQTGGGTGGMTGVGGGATRDDGLVSAADVPVSHGSDLSPVAGGVAVSAGRGSDVGDADHSYGGERGGLSGGTMGGSSEQETGGGLSGGMRSGMGTDVSGGMGGSRGGDIGDPNQGGADVTTDDEIQRSRFQATGGIIEGRDTDRKAQQ